MKKAMSIVLTALMLISSLSVSASADFSDVNAGDWYYESVQFAKDKGWVNGFEDGTFKPDDTLTKAQAVSIVARAAGLEIPVTDGPWYAGAVTAGMENGLIFNELFLDEPVAREQVFFMLHAGFNFGAVDKTVRDDITPFTDFQYNVFSKVIPTFYSFGLLSGYNEDGVITVKPKGNLTRAEMCTLLKSVSEFDFEAWKQKQDFFSDDVVREHLVKMIEKNESKCVMYAYGKSDFEITARLQQVVQMCFDEYEDKYPDYFKNYSTACGSVSIYEEENCVKVTFEMTEK